MDEQEFDDLIGPGEAGRILGVTSERVRQLISQGKLTATRGPYGYRILRRADVLELVKERARARARRR